MSYRKGYFMSIEQEQAAKGQLLLEYQEAKYRIGPLRAAADKLAVTFEHIAKQLRAAPEHITFNAAVLINANAELGTLIDDLRATSAEIQRLHDRVREAGMEHLIK